MKASLQISTWSRSLRYSIAFPWEQFALFPHGTSSPFLLPSVALCQIVFNVAETLCCFQKIENNTIRNPPFCQTMLHFQASYGLLEERRWHMVGRKGKAFDLFKKNCKNIFLFFLPSGGPRQPAPQGLLLQRLSLQHLPPGCYHHLIFWQDKDNWTNFLDFFWQYWVTDTKQ